MTSVAELVVMPSTGRRTPWRVVLVLAARELRSGLSGFYIFIACVALGVTVITGVGAVTDALRRGFERQGEAILGGDVTLARMHARADASVRSWLDARGRTSETATLRSMARRLDGEDQALIELKAVDSAYPLVGTIEVKGAAFDSAVRDGLSAVADPVLLERLGLKIGDQVRIGNAQVTVRGTIVSEPDGLVDRLTYGPRVFVSLETLEKTDLIKPGTLARWRYAVKLPKGTGEDARVIEDFRRQARQAFPESGFTISDRRDPSPQISRTLERMRQFLTLLGLTALLVGGVGVANAVTTFIERRRHVIATMKSLGATSGLVFRVFLLQVLAMAGLGVAIGLALGLMLPMALAAIYGDVLPIKADLSPSAASVVTGIVYGLLAALLFALWPLGRAEVVSPSVLFRDDVASDWVRPRARILALTAGTGAVLVAFAIFLSESQRVAIYFCLGLIVVFGVFFALGSAVTWAARRLARPRVPELALAMANLSAPGGLARSVVLSLGAGLSLLVAVALADSSLVSELTSRLPAQSPSYFVLDVTKDIYPDFERLVRETPGAKLEAAPMLRGRLIALKGQNVETLKAPPEAQWVLNGDRGLTYSDRLPVGSKLVAGDWWPANYDGEPLVSFESTLARHLDLKIGDSITVNVLGRNVTARIANLREVKWESLALNFVMVFSPNTLEAAPHNILATISLPKDLPLQKEVRLAREIGRAFPTVTVIRVKDAIDAFNDVFTKVMVAVRVAGGVTLLAGALVLAGALATAQRRRIVEAVILKVLGATRGRILRAHFAEYFLLAAITAVFAVGLGVIAAWVAVAKVMEIEFIFSWRPVAGALALAIGLIALFGGFGTWAVLRARPMPYLRSE